MLHTGIVECKIPQDKQLLFDWSTFTKFIIMSWIIVNAQWRCSPTKQQQKPFKNKIILRQKANYFYRQLVFNLIIIKLSGGGVGAKIMLYSLYSLFASFYHFFLNWKHWSTFFPQSHLCTCNMSAIIITVLWTNLRSFSKKICNIGKFLSIEKINIFLAVCFVFIQISN